MKRRSYARPAAVVASAALVAGALTACSTASTAQKNVVVDELWDSSDVHDIAIEADDAVLDEAIDTYLESGEKMWVSADVTIDGTTLENVGLKLKGNSSLRAISADDDPATMPWIIRLDEFVDGQDYEGETELVVRANSTETALNEAVALELLGEAGLAAEKAVSSRFSVNGGDEELRLVIQNPNDEWDAANFGDDGMLYKAEAEGDYSYRGDDPESYVDIFEQEVGDDFTPLTDFLLFLNESDDATFAADLDDYLDTEAFATYLAYQSLIDNVDDISGGGNNSYLRFDSETGQMTVVSWDLNLAFGTSNVGRGGAMQQGGAKQQGGGGGRPGGGGPGNQSNILEDRFLADASFSALYDEAVERLTASLFTSGVARSALAEWTEVLAAQATDLVSAATIEEESATLAAKIEAVG